MHAKLSFSAAEPKGRITMEDFVHEDTKGPHVSLGPIDIVYECFWTHVDWASNIDVFPSFPA
jgi:hypothetical protein